MSQTTLQAANALRWGSAKCEAALYSSGFGSLQNLGAIRNLTIQETWDDVRVDSDNAGVIKNRIKSQKVMIKFNWLEPTQDKLYLLRGQSLDTYATVAAAPTAVTDENITLTNIDFERFAYKDADDTVVASIVVTTNASTPVTLTKDTDYVVAVDSEGWTGIARIEGGAITSGDTVLVDYSYTPATQKTRSTGGKYTIAPIVLRFTNTNESSNDDRIDIYEAYIKAGTNRVFKADEADDVNELALEFEGVLDESRTAGDQLYKEFDAQETA